jgi:hypothetical protein
LGDPLKRNLLLLYKPLHLEAQQVSTRIEVRRHHGVPRIAIEDVKDAEKEQCASSSQKVFLARSLLP